MAGSREIKAGKAAIEIIAETDPLKRTLAKGSAMLRSWGSNLSSVSSMVSGLWAGIAGSAAATGLAATIKTFADVGSELNDMAARTGVAGSKLQELGFMAKQSGASMEDIEKALRFMAKNGIPVSEFEKLGQSIAGNVDPTERAAQAMENFGKTGTKLLPMFRDFNQLRASSEALGPILSEDDIRRADELGDAFGSLKEAMSRAMQQIGASLGPQLKGLLDTAIGMVVSFSNSLNDLNEFGRGGDWLDKAAEFLRTPLSSFAARGAEAAGNSRAASPMAGGDFEDAEESSAKVKDNWDQIVRAVRQSHEERNRLIEGFSTPAEAFIRRQKEIIDAMKELNRNRLSGFVSDEAASAQMRGLNEARARLRFQEQERLAGIAEQRGELQQRMRELMKRGGPSFSSQGTFSSAGAALLGRAGEAIEKMSLEEEKRQTEELRKIRGELGKLARPKFS